MSGRYFVSTAATLSVCFRCRTLTLKALAEGIPVRVDITPIDAAQELAALIAGHNTFTVHHDGELAYRHPEHISDPNLTPVLAEHRCGPHDDPNGPPPF